MVTVVLRRIGDGARGSVGLRKAKHLLDAHLQANRYLSAKAVASWVKETFGVVSYTESGMTAVLQEQVIPTNTGRRRVNINGTIDLDRLEPVVRFDDTINADSTIALFEQLVAFHPMAVCIYVICDNSPYYRSKAVQGHLKASRIQLVFLPPYAPNLNLIERLWRFFKKRVLYNRYYETFVEFQTACETCFKNPRKYQPEFHSLLTANFEIIG